MTLTRATGQPNGTPSRGQRAQTPHLPRLCRQLVDRYYDPTTDQFLSVDPDLAETGQPYAFTGDDPLNKTDPLGLTAGPMRPPKAVCSNSPHKRNCETKVKKAQSCGRLGCYDAKNAHKALPEAVGVALFVTTGGLGDLAEGPLVEAANAVRTALSSDEAASAAHIARIVAGGAATSLVLRNLGERFDATANDPSVSPTTRAVASVDVGIVQVLDPISIWHDEWDLFGDDDG
jgi:RHS repeat-associated protein